LSGAILGGSLILPIRDLWLSQIEVMPCSAFYLSSVPIDLIGLRRSGSAGSRQCSEAAWEHGNRKYPRVHWPAGGRTEMRSRIAEGCSP
jgi:hypothetical protein